MSRMKTVFISVYTFVFILFITAIFYYGWKEREREEQERDIFLEEKARSGLDQETEEIRETDQEIAANENNFAEEENSEPPLKETISENSKIGKDTIYRLEIYDTFTQELTVEETGVPPEWIGMTREELQKYWKDYTLNLPLEEFEKGLLSCDLTSFSSQQCTVRKTYDGSGLKYRYYMILEQGCLSVYYSDKKTPYEHTDIMEEDLPKKEAEKLKQGVYIEDEESLYGILESYTS